MIENVEKPALKDEDLDNMSREEIISSYKQLKNYTNNLEEREKKNLFELAKLKNIILMNYVSSKEFESSVKKKLIN